MSVLEIWNQALSAVNARGRLNSLVDRTPEQEVCDRWYPLVLDTIQQAAWWPACKAHARLALLSEREDDEWFDGEPEPGYAFAYAQPDNYLHPWHLSDYSRFSLSYSQARNRVMISTNTENPILVYARRNEAVEQWTPGQREATVQALAAKIAGPLTGKNSMIDRHFQLALRQIENEQAKMANIIEPDPRPAVPWLAARGVQSFASVRFFYPFGSLAGLGNAS
ncbi:MAG: hypothetical protein HC888_01425 [Candidatus Competibacteraceae bacterium]|nr:hypothetical protein [Candidatus Competibacteraceae bacterium]